MKTLITLALACMLTLACVAQVPPPASPTPAVVTREQLEKRLKELEDGRQQAMANVNAYGGAIQETQRWLDELKAAEAKAKQSKLAPTSKPEAPHPQP